MSGIRGNTGVILVAKYVRDLLGVAEGSTIVIGRDNVRVDDMTALKISVDSTAAAEVVGRHTLYDGATDTQTYALRMRAPCVVEFWGNTAFASATSLLLQSLTQDAYETQRDLGVAVHIPTGVTDIGQLVGESRYERYAVDVVAQYTLSTTGSVLTIETEQLTLASEEASLTYEG